MPWPELSIQRTLTCSMSSEGCSDRFQPLPQHRSDRTSRSRVWAR